MEAGLGIFIVESLVIVILGSLLHFTYDWSGENKFVGFFSAVNESTWEHIKLALSAIFICTLVDVWFLGSNQNYWYARNLSFIVPVLVIPVLFYGYRSFVRHSILIVDISIFVVAAILSELVFVVVLNGPTIGPKMTGLSLAGGVLILTAYLLLTKFPLHNFLFEDPITHRYGFDGHKKLMRRHKK